MDKQVFLDESDFYNQLKIEQVKLLCYYQLSENGIDIFTISDVEDWFHGLSLPKPNKSRILEKVRRSKYFLKGTTDKSFRLHGKTIKDLNDSYKELQEPSDEIINYDTILPKALYENTRGYIERLAKQINASYESNIFDGCAVLMRRLTEVTIILTFKKLDIEDEIMNGDRHVGMKLLIDTAIKNQTLDLTTDSRKCIHKFRELGNFSAHKVYYNCKRKYIQEVIPEYRALIEELSHKAQLI
ncbi:MAG TPA: hypothetical protein VK084_11250 [Chitinophagaceae bacterium]|nr:hypothetical protein [Chitinophagaceae bacterium]